LTRVDDFDEAQELPGSDEIIAARRALETCQPDHPDRAKRCLILSKLLYSLFKSTGNKGPLEETITLEREMLALRPREHPIHAKLCSSLAISLKKHYLRFGGSGAVLDEIISLHEVCLELRPHGDPLRDGTCVALATNLRQKYTVAGDPALLHRAMELIEEVIKLQPKGDPVRLTVRMEQAALLRALYFRSTDVQLLRKAVLLEREILLHYPPGHRRRAPNCGSLARSLNLLYNTGGPDTTSALDEAIELEKEVLVLCPPGHRLRHAACESISISLHKRAHVGSRGLADLEESILFAREALELRSPGHFARNASLVALAQVLRERYIRTGNIPDLDEVIALERQAIAAYPVGHTQRATAFVSLANSLRRSFDRTGDVRVLEEAYEHAKTGLGLRPSGHALRPGALIAVVVLLNTLSTIRSYRSDAFIHDAIAYGREATQLCPKGRGHAHRAPSCMGLAASLKLLFGRTGDEALLHEAIALETEALELRLPDDIDRPTSCTNLAVSLNMLHEHNPTLDLQDRVIALEKEALSLRRPKDPLRAAACTNLASSLRKRFMLTKDTSFLKTATDLDIEALNIQSPDHPRRLQLSVDLSISYTKWYEVSLDKTHLAAAIATCKQGLASTSQSNPARWRGSLQLAQLLLFETSTFDADAIIPLMSEAANPQADDPPALLAGLAHIISLLNLKLAKEADLLRILQVHDQIIGLMPLVAGHTLDARNQLQVTKSCAEIGRAAFACAARAGQVTQGLALIERARGVMWSQALKLRDPQINTLPKAQGNELTSLISSLSLTQKNQLSTERIGDSDARFLTNRDVRHVQGRRLQTLIEEIRGIPGQEMFMHGLPITTLLQASARHPVVVLVPALDYCRALILHSPNDVVMLPFPEVKIPDLWTMVLGATCDDDQGPRGLKGRQRGIKVISSRPKDTLSQLWVRIVKPIVLQLGFKVSQVVHKDILSKITYCNAVTEASRRGSATLALVSNRRFHVLARPRRRYTSWKSPRALL
jgi:hypothetical protein